MEIRVVTEKTAHDSGEFESRVDAVAWLAGAMIAFDGAKEFHVEFEWRQRTVATAPGIWPWYWYVSVFAHWPKDERQQPDPATLDVTAVRDALVDVTQSANAPRGDER